jgi:RNA 3'-terminal phosphate cyclase (ATP)
MRSLLLGLAGEKGRIGDSDVALDVHLADQVLLPLALASGGEFSTLAPSGHTRTNAAVIGSFLPIAYEESALGPKRWRIALRRDGPAAAQ